MLPNYSPFRFQTRLPVLLAGLLLAVGLGWLTANNGLVIPTLLVVGAVALPLLIKLWQAPRIGLLVLLGYCFLFFIIARESGSTIPFGMVVDGLLVLLWVIVLVQFPEFDWQPLNSDLVWLGVLWFGLNVLEIANPSGASFQGWYQEMRSTTLYWLLAVPLVMLLFNRQQDLDLFLKIIIVLSVLGALNGLRQLYIGLTPGDKAFLAENAKTHLLWGKLRVFSFYSDAGQFGAAQAHVALVAGILALGPFRAWKRVLLALAAGIIIVGMFISGTRGSLFALMAGIAVALLISKNIRAFLAGSVLAGLAFCFLKFTHIGDTNYNIYRMRTALDPNDASFNVRLHNQQLLRQYLASRPFGGGVGTIGNSGIHYNAGTVLAKIPPDSYWVKVWAMYGIVGFTIWLGIMLYILGKCCGIAWGTRDPALKVKLIALTAGVAGSLFCSYGNEVINFMPSAIIVYFSWALVYMGPKMDTAPGVSLAAR